eukprot:scaffold42078_cov294-Skeletonema_dohrnii-CCMP3373.AAC.1
MQKAVIKQDRLAFLPRYAMFANSEITSTCLVRNSKWQMTAQSYIGRSTMFYDLGILLQFRKVDRSKSAPAHAMWTHCF